jgi:hypothetical protein
MHGHLKQQSRHTTKSRAQQDLHNQRRISTSPNKPDFSSDIWELWVEKNFHFAIINAREVAKSNCSFVTSVRRKQRLNSHWMNLREIVY